MYISRSKTVKILTAGDGGVRQNQRRGFKKSVLSWRLKQRMLSATVIGNGIICFPKPVPVWGRGTPLPPLSIYFLIFSPFHFSLSFIGFTYFLLLSIPSLSTRIVPLRFQAGGRRRRTNLGLVCVLFCTLCYLYSLLRCIVVFCSIWFSYFSFVCSFSALTLLVGSFDP